VVLDKSETESDACELISRGAIFHGPNKTCCPFDCGRYRNCVGNRIAMTLIYCTEPEPSGMACVWTLGWRFVRTSASAPATVSASIADSA
jgi:hypothetical protein